MTIFEQVDTLEENTDHGVMTKNLLTSVAEHVTDIDEIGADIAVLTLRSGREIYIIKYKTDKGCDTVQVQAFESNGTVVRRQPKDSLDCNNDFYFYIFSEKGEINTYNRVRSLIEELS